MHATVALLFSIFSERISPTIHPSPFSFFPLFPSLAAPFATSASERKGEETEDLRKKAAETEEGKCQLAPKVRLIA